MSLGAEHIKTTDSQGDDSETALADHCSAPITTPPPSHFDTHPVAVTLTCADCHTTIGSNHTDAGWEQLFREYHAGHTVEEVAA